MNKNYNYFLITISVTISLVTMLFNPVKADEIIINDPSEIENINLQETEVNSEDVIMEETEIIINENSETLEPETLESEILEPEIMIEKVETETLEPEIMIEKVETNPEETETIEGEINPETEPENQLSPEEIARFETLKQADQLYLSGNISEAETLYRTAKKPFTIETENLNIERPQAYSDPELLPPAGMVYWRMSAQGLEQNLESKIFVPLKLLVEKFPQFIPGYLRYAEALQDYEKLDEAVQILDQAVTLYPNEPDLLLAKIEADNQAEKWLDASLAARRFALLNPDHPQSSEFLQLADQNLAKYQEHLQAEITGNAIANIFTGALGFILTGNIFGPLSALETTMLLLQGETGIGEQIAGQVKDQVPLLEDEEVNQYITEIGNKIVGVTGRNDFQYEFYIIMDDTLNAFALPGGKVFVNSGAILETESEAELAGLLAHELAHAVLSHGFVLVTQGNLTANIVGNIPYIGGIATNLIVLNYSRDMEVEADLLGTRILANSGYAADGVRNLMAILATDDEPNPPAWLSTHPDTDQRVTYLEAFILENGFNRYAYEGISHHQEIQAKVTQLWQEYQETDECKERELNERGY